MLHHLKTYQKLIAITLLYALVLTLEMYFYNLSFVYTSYLTSIILTFVQCWVLILVGFLFFQVFKGFTMWKDFYKKRKFETPQYFSLLGVNGFQFVLINSFFRHLNPRVYLKGKTREYIKTYHSETIQSETSHWLALYPTFVVQFLFAYHDNWLCFIWLSIWSLIFNIYPILLQRKNRFILEKRFGAMFTKTL